MPRIIVAALIGHLLLLSGPVVQAEALPLVRLQLKWQHRFQFAGYYAAKEKGYYEAAGMNVEILEAGPAQDVIPRLLDGRADFGVWNSSLLLDREAGAPVVALAAVFQHSALALAVRNEVGIRSIHDLAGKHIMLDPAAAEIYAYMKREGLTQDRFNPVPPSQKLEDHFRSSVDAFTVYITNQTYHIQRLNLNYQLFSPRSAGIDFYGDNLCTTEAYLRAHPGRVRAFREASLKGWEYAMAHPKEIAELIQRRYNPAAKLDELLFEAEAMRPLMAMDLLPVGYMHPGRWQHIAEVYTELGLMRPGFDLEGFVFDPAPPSLDMRSFYKIIGAAGLLLLLLACAFIYVSRNSRRQAASLKRQLTVFDNAPVAFIVADAQGIILDWNRAAEDIFGWSAAEARGKDIQVLVPERERDHVALVLNTAAHQDVSTHSINRNVTKDGRELLCQWQNARYFDDLGNPLGTLSIGMDVTARHALEAEIRDAKEVAEQLTAHLQALLTDQRQFLSMISHEVRVPLAIIESNCEVLQVHADPLASSSAAIARIRRGARRLADFFENCLTQDRLESLGWTLQVQPIELDAFLRTVLDKARLAGPEHTLELHNRAPGVVLKADSHLLEVLLINLMDNGLKYSPAGTTVTLGARLDQAGWLVLWVRDQGIGIPAGDMDLVMKKFHRGKNVAQVPGAGLGLTLVSRIVTLHNGQLHLESRRGEGTVATVRLPLTDPSPDSAEDLG